MSQHDCGMAELAMQRWLPMTALSLCLFTAPLIGADGARPTSSKPLAVRKGVHLLLDDYLIASSSGVARRVMSPQRSLSEPIVTGALEHQNWQPFFTVLHDPAATKPFRMWYNVDAVDDLA